MSTPALFVLGLLVVVEAVRAVGGEVSPLSKGAEISSVPDIYLESCPATVSETDDDVGETVTQCVHTSAELLCENCMANACKLKFHEKLEGLYECKECPFWQHGCDPSITSSGFDPDVHCTLTGPIQTDCDPAHAGLEWFQSMECNRNDMDWTYACSGCVDN